MMRHARISSFSAALLALTLPAFAQEIPVWSDATWLTQRTDAAYFHVSVAGKLANGSHVGAPDEEARTGKAFAVGPNLLVTSQHVIGEQGEWAPKTGVSVEIARAWHPLDRSLTLTRFSTVAGLSTYNNPIVLPAPGAAIDAAGLSIPEAKFDAYFQLSMCDIAKGKSYAAVISGASNPSDVNSIEHTSAVPLKAVGYLPAYGPLYVFEVVDASNFSGEPNGNDGSPILDYEGNVVAVVSAVLARPAGSGYYVLGTPIQPLFPSAAALLARAPDLSTGVQGGLRCSLADAVSRINRQMVAYATWSIRVDRQPDGKPSGMVYLRYESVAEDPNILSIKIEFDYLGRQRQDATTIRSLRYAGGSNAQLELTLPTPLTSREFSTNKIVKEGLDLVEPSVTDPNIGGSLDLVEIRIYETRLLDKRVLKKETTLNFKWSQP